MIDDKANIAKKLSQTAKNKIAQDYGAKRWRQVRDNDINHLIEQSREVWDLMLKNISVDSPVNVATTQQIENESPQSRLRLGIVPKALMTITAVQHKAVFGSDDRWFSASPLNEFAKEGREKYETFLAQNFGKRNITQKWKLHMMNKAADGTALAAVHYKQKERERTVYEHPKILGIALPITQAKKQKMMEWEGTDITPLGFNEWVANPYVEDFDDAWLIVRDFKSTDWVKQKYDLDEVSTYSEWHNQDQSVIKEKFGFPTEITRSQVDVEEDNQKALLMYVYDDFFLEGEAYRNHMAVVLNDTEVVYFGPNPYNHGKKPYILGRYIEIPGQLYGKGAITDVVPCAAALDGFTHRALDATNLSSVAVFEALDSEEIWDETLDLTNGRIYPVQRLGSIRQIEINSPGIQETQFFVDYLSNLVQEHVGANEVLSGDNIDPGDKPTAFQVSSHVQGASLKHEDIIEGMKHYELEPYLTMAHENFQQYLKSRVAVPLEKEPMTRDEIRLMDMEFTITGASAAASKNQEIGQLMELFGTLIPQGLQMGFIKLKDGVTEVDVHHGIRNLFKLAKMDVDTLIEYKSPEDLMQEQQLNGQQAEGLPALPPMAGGGVSVTEDPLAGMDINAA